MLVGVLTLHALGLLVYALLQGRGLTGAVLASAPPAALAALAARAPGRRLPAVLVAVGLCTCAAMVIHLSGGVDAAHFDFFVVVILLALYEDWVPFLVAMLYVLVHHGLLGSLGPSAAAVESHAPGEHWTWALIHAGFLSAAAAGLLILWRFNEDVRHRLRALVDASGDAIVELDRRSKVVGWNPAAQAMLGYAPEEIECRPASVLAAPGRSDELERLLAGALRGEPIQREETSWARKDGKTVEVAVTVSSIRDAGRVVGASIVVNDMGERLALREAEQRFRDLVERVPAVTYVAEPGEDGRWRYVSPQIEALLGYTPGEWLADPLLWIRRIHSDDRQRVLAEEERFTATREALAVEYRMVARDGTVVWVRDDAVFRTRRPGRAEVMDGILTDVTQLKELEERLRHLASHDHMTGLCNRHRFEEELERQLAYTQRYGTPGALLVLDLDGLKEVNDELGHHAGDALLKLVAAGVRDRLRAVDTVGRLGGDEFGVFLPGVDEAGARSLAAGLVERIRLTSVELEGRAVGTTASLGIALLREGDGVDGGRLLMQADIAMYGAKNAGGDSVALYESTGGAERAAAG